MLSSSTFAPRPTITSAGSFCIAVDSTQVYVAENGAGLLLALPLGGGTPVTLASDPRPVRLAVNAAALYWTSQMGTVKSVPLTGGFIRTITAGTGETDGIALDAVNVYWSLAGQGGAILSVPLAGGYATTIASNQDDPLTLAVSASAAYWIDGDVYGSTDGGCLMTAALQDAGAGPVALSPFDNLGGGAVVVDAANVYWTEKGSIFEEPLAEAPRRRLQVASARRTSRSTRRTSTGRIETQTPS